MNSFVNITKDASGGVYLDPNLAALLGNASLEAYTDFSKANEPTYTPPALVYGTTTFNYVNRFTGFDDVAWGSGSEERYGVIYQWSAKSDVYLIAFRGTSSAYDMVLDLESATTIAFSPYQNNENFPSDVHVGDGFNKIYSTKNHSMSASMQQQIFDFITSLPTPPSQIVITGHSLGSALASLFTLDVAASLPEISVANINFASPRVGPAKWQTIYNQTYNLQNSTVEIRNSYDLVPKVPTSQWPFDFRDVGNLFPVSFSVKNYHIDFGEIVLAWHALKNYQYVVNNATVNSPQVWTGQFTDQAYPTWEMVSYNPYTTTSDIEKSQDRSTIRSLVHAQRQRSGT